jgi:hypothetical protein
MATRSTISILKKDGSLRSVYCHWDGYLEGVGETLIINYKTPQQVNELIENGDISSLGLTINESEFYHKKDSRIAYLEYKSLDEQGYFHSLQDYNYIYKEQEQRWEYFRWYEINKMTCFLHHLI